MKTMLIKNARFIVQSLPFNILENGAIYIEDSHIQAVGPTADLAHYEPMADVVIDASDKLVMPGLVDAHNHVGECHMFTLFGFLASPLTGIGDALDRVVWPAWCWIPEEAAYDLEMLGFMHLLKSGTTTVQDCFMWPDEAGRAAVDSGLRVENSPTLVTSLRLKDSKGPEDDLARTEAAIQKWHGAANGRVTYRVHASATYNCHEWFLKECAALANRYDVGFATHLAESVDESKRARSVWPEGEVRRAYDLGLMGPKSLFFHSCVLNDEEMALYAETGSSAAHCPPTNSMLGNVAYVPKMMAMGVNVGLGTDMPTHDMFKAMLSVSQQHAIMPREMRGLMPWTPLEMATVNGARALNLQDEIGTLEPGKKADIITIDLSRNTRLFPLIPQVLSTFITVNGTGADVADVIVDGDLLMRDQQLVHLDEQAIMARAQGWADEFLAYYMDMVERGEPLIPYIHDEFQP
ncbi:MAG TPA: amidohydrolase family protein [Aggregatilinea sp.]|jgi:cytosine/adenosine deaminase-related metal-dependent hydrolase|uniref:amidohydrolase family protein n=1 Tax=Aggregatilinea sp. TaxID=2806333 RepID=UPI002B69F92C|nr:amidohydrolase family protein [Aggregatilinea sp.]HML21942.1 amidohydrolase family protein [Aggregatilinea sp.]